MLMKEHGFIHYFVTALYHFLIGVVSSLTCVALGVVGYILFTRIMTPLNLIIGAPLMLTGACLAINFLYTSVLIIFSPTYNRGMCRFCNSN